MRVLALAAAAKRIHKRRIAVLDERIAAVKASMAARRKQAIAMAAAVVAAGEAATEPRREVRRALGMAPRSFRFRYRVRTGIDTRYLHKSS